MTGHGGVFTFYSFKGGTGRTMALANTAVLLASDVGSRVLLIDFDLEAPGLHRYFPEVRDRGATGIIDLVERLARGLPAEGHTSPSIEALLDSVQLESYIRPTRFSNIDLIVAGTVDGAYGERVATFKWEAFYLSAPELMTAVMQRLLSSYSHILVDSRTGLNDVSGLCTAVLPEKLVVVFTPNEQNLGGCTDVIANATAYRRQSDDLRALVVYPLPSRIENAEPVERDLWRLGDGSSFQGYQRRFETSLRGQYGLSHCDLEPYFDDVQIPHVPFYSYGEKIAVELERSRDVLSLSSAYERFVEWLQREPWSGSRQEAALAYARAVIQLNANVRLPGTYNTASIHEAFVPPQLAFTKPRGARRFSGRILTQFPRLLVTGEAGSGKSTLVQALVVQYALPWTKDEPPADSTVLPIAIRCADFMDDVAHRPLEEVLRASIGRVGLNEPYAATLRGALKAWLRAGRVALFLDDIDSLPSDDTRRRFARRVQQFALEFPKCSIVALCREVDLAVEMPAFTPVRIAPLDRGHKLRFIRSWNTTLPRRGARHGLKTLEELVLSHPNAWVTSTPLLLGLALSVLEQIGRINDLEVCRGFVNVMVGRSNSKGESHVHAVRTALQVLAALQLGLSSKTAEEQILFARTNDVARRALSPLLATGIVKMRHKQWVVAHRLLAEFLAAEHLVENSLHPTRALRDLIMRVDRLRFIGVIRFAVQLLNDEQRASALLSILTADRDEMPRKAAERAILATAAMLDVDDVDHSLATRILSAFKTATTNEELRGTCEPLLHELARSRWGGAFEEIRIVANENVVSEVSAKTYELLASAEQATAENEHSRAAELYSQLLASTANTELVGYTLIARARVFVRVNKAVEALADLRSARDIGESTNNIYLVGEAVMEIVEIFAGLHQWKEAERLLREFLQNYGLSGDLEVQELLARANFYLAYVLVRHNRVSDANAVIGQLLERFADRQESGILRFVCEALLLRSTTLAQAEEITDAIAALDEVSTRFVGRDDLVRYVHRAQIVKARLLAERAPDDARAILRRLLLTARRSRHVLSDDDTLKAAETLLASLEEDER